MHPRLLSELLGHSSMESLTPYLSVTIEDLKEAHRRCHPREREPLPGRKTVAKQTEAKPPDSNEPTSPEAKPVGERVS